jgi:CheY-like chemotaxis protein
MGLATVYGIVKQHKGHIDVQSEPGKGTTFSIYLPAAEGEIEVRAEEKPERILTGNETILVVDDEPLLRDIIVEMLNPLGYKVLKASHGEEALLVSSKFSGKIDLLLTDVIMPGMNGKELADALVHIRPETKVIFISGYTDDAIAHHGVLEEGIVLLQKPVTEKMLASKIREVLDRDNHSLACCPEHESLDGLHILLADDNEDIRKLIASYLKGHECHLDTAENGKIAVDKYKVGTYDYVLMDMQMPVMDGLTAVREIRKWEKEHDRMPTTIIALTGNASQEDIDRCMEAGYTSHLAKPIKKEQLMKAICSYTSSKQDHTGEAGKEVRGKVVAYVDSDLKDLIPEYLEERQDDIKKIQSAMNAEDYETVRIMGHTLKGSGGGYGFEQITEIGVHLEEAAKQENPEGIKKMIQELTDYIDNVDVVFE